MPLRNYSLTHPPYFYFRSSWPTDLESVTWCAPRDDSFHQVWSWYDHPLPRYCCWYVTWPCDLLTLVSDHTQWVKWLTPLPSLKVPWLSVLALWVLTSPIGYQWQCLCTHCACAISLDLCVEGKFFRHIWNPWPWFASSLYNFYGATIKTNGVICQNRLWPYVKDHIAVCVCAKWRQPWTLP